jgi:hypothetical protein
METIFLNKIVYVVCLAKQFNRHAKVKCQVFETGFTDQSFHYCIVFSNQQWCDK